MGSFFFLMGFAVLTLSGRGSVVVWLGDSYWFCWIARAGKYQ